MIATALVQGVVDPQMCGIAGFGSMPIYMPKRGFHGFTDFHGKRRGLTCGPHSLSPRRAAVSA
jgi:gamma-glutamyltranspeptidase/glutathione hydrolase